MKRPSGELVSLDFYFGDRTCADGLRDVVCNRLEAGALFSGEIILCEFEGARDAKFPSIYSERQSETRVTEQELRREMERSDARVIAVGLWNAIGLAARTPEIVTFSGISEEAPPGEANPISIVGEGWHFSTPGYENERCRDAQKCYRQFIRICIDRQPMYAAILNEDSLPCRFDLGRGRGADCFMNFFLSERAFGAPLISEVQSMYRDAYTERHPEGLYVATRLFAPKNITLDRNVAATRAEVVAGLIAS